MDGDIALCPPDEIRREVEWAVRQWNDAILYFSLRYLMIDLLKTKITVVDDPSKCNVRFSFYDHPHHTRSF